ncbi:MAG: FAD:protein FMN transferase [Verrucomicrobiota bacterium]|nr:FAD:protein FMN transferase [Verrucomicrobiota bacterium]
MLAANEPPALTRLQPHLGTLVSITVHHQDRAAAQRAINAAFGEFRAVDKLLSIHRTDSELAALNRTAGLQSCKASPELFAALQSALQIARQTDGAFDPTIRPLADLWGFIKKEGYRLPTPAERVAVLPRIGWRKVSLDPTRRLVRFRAPGLSLDPGGFGKGLAVDRAITRLQKDGIRTAMVKAGGDLRVIGLPPGKNYWTVRIEDPLKKGSRTIIRLKTGALSTSGNYENFFIANGRRYSHLLDPRTGLPVQGMASCTVTAPTSLEADALATACFVLGVKESTKQFGRRYGMRFVTESGGTLKTVTSEKFPR